MTTIVEAKSIAAVDDDLTAADVQNITDQPPVLDESKMSETLPVVNYEASSSSVSTVPVVSKEETPMEITDEDIRKYIAAVKAKERAKRVRTNPLLQSLFSRAGI